MCENLISLTFKCLAVLLFSSSFVLLFVLFFIFHPSLLHFLVPFHPHSSVRPSFLTSPLHTLRLPHSVSLLTRNTKDTPAIYPAWWVQRTAIFISDIHLPCPLLLLLFSFSFPLSSFSSSVFPRPFPFNTLSFLHPPVVCPSSSLPSMCHVCFISLSSCPPGERERPSRPQQGHGGPADRRLQDLWSQRHTYPDQIRSVCVCVSVLV